jgi:hypothetical protein
MLDAQGASNGHEQNCAASAKNVTASISAANQEQQPVLAKFKRVQPFIEGTKHQRFITCAGET